MSASLVATGRSALKLRFLPGLPGKPGPANVLTIGTVETGAAGSAAAATITGTSPAQVLALTIPKGDQGVPGPVSPLAVGTVTTGAPGSAASATITGSAPNQALNLTIPRGDAGAAGTGSGNVNPTGGGYANGKVALFADATGNVIKVGPTLGDAAAKNTGSTNGTLAAGDDARIVLNAPLLVAANRTIVTTDARRLLRFTSSSTQTLTAAATLGAAWSVLLSNEGPGVQTFTPASGETIDGLVGSRLLFPKQKAMLVCDGSGFSWLWLEREPVVAALTIAAAASSFDLAIPGGYPAFIVEGNGILNSVASQPYGMRPSVDGTTFPATTDDYGYSGYYSNGASAPIGEAPSGAASMPIGTGSPDASRSSSFWARLQPGAPGTRTIFAQESTHITGGGLPVTVKGASFTALSGRSTTIRIFASSGTFTAGTFTVRGVQGR